MQNDPMQSTTHPITSKPDPKDEDTKKDKNKDSGLPKKDDEDFAQDESRPEDYEKFDVDKVDELEKSKKEDKS